MPRALAVRLVLGNFQTRNDAEGGRVALHDGVARSAHFIALGELYQPNGSLDVCDVVLEPCLQNAVEPRTFSRIAFPSIPLDSVQAHDANSFGDRIAFGGEHSAFAGGKGFGGIETEGADLAYRADRSAAIRSGQGMRSVLNDSQPVSSG